MVAAIAPAVCRMIAPSGHGLPGRNAARGSPRPARPLARRDGQGNAAAAAGQDRLGEEERREGEQFTGAERGVPVTAALAASTAQRRGTAVTVVRMRPVLYSEVKTSTPRTLTGSTVYSA